MDDAPRFDRYWRAAECANASTLITLALAEDFGPTAAT